MTLQKSIIATFSILIVLLWTTLADEGQSAVSDKRSFGPGTNYALIIGINSYNNWSNLKSPAKDAEEISKILIEKYNFKKSKVTLITDNTKDQPTLSNIVAAIDKNVNNLTSKDNFLFFFSGHSTEDDDGNTYWIPKDGKKTTKMTWLKHADLCDEYFSSVKFKAKNVCIIADSLFSHDLIKSRSISLTPYDLRYPEKIQERASRRSREVISFDEEHWPGSMETDGLGLFTYYIRKALTDNTLEVIDFENLIFDEAVLFPVTKIAGTKMLRGRLKTTMDARGQFIIRKFIPASLIDITDTVVSPEKGYPGDLFMFTAKTRDPANEVYLDIEGRKHLMEGRGTEWKLKTKVSRLGKTSFSVTATNKNGTEGEAKKGLVTTIKKLAAVANVKKVMVTPTRGTQGDNYSFNVVTDAPASKVALIIKDKQYPMNGSGNEWFLKKKVEEPGNIDFSVLATNEDGIQGRRQNGNIQIQAARINIVEVKASPETGFAGEEFTITARTNLPADSVTVKLGDNFFAMEGSGKKWSYAKKIPDTGKKQFIVTAKNINGQTGTSMQGELLAKKSPLAIPDIAQANIRVVSPGKGYPGDKFLINVKTSAPSDMVHITIEDKKHTMKGSGTQWSHLAKIDKLGISQYTIIAKNKDGVQGKSKEGTISTTKKPAKPVNVLTAAVSPQKGQIGRKFTFKADTDKPAEKVTLVIDKNRYGMTGSGTSWSFNKKLDKAGDFDFSIIAFNEDNAKGTAKTASFTVVKQRFNDNNNGTITDLLTGKTVNRFTDNGDGTITDLLTSLMWLKQPKQIAVNWNQAVEYCRNLEFEGYTGWRLPTISEWRKLSDKKQQNPALPEGNPFSNVLTHTGYWSKTKHKFGPQYVYKMGMWYGKTGYQKKSDNGIVWPVRYVELSI